MTAKEYLKQVRKADVLIDCKLKRLEELNDSITSLKSTITPDKVQSSGAQDKVGNTVAKIIDLQNEINDDIDRLVDLKREIMKVLDELEPTYARLLYLRYFEFKTWEAVAAEMHYTHQWVTGTVHGKPGLHIQALNAVQRIIDNT